MSIRFHLVYLFGHKNAYTNGPVNGLVMTKRIKNLHMARAGTAGSANTIVKYITCQY